MSLSSPGCSFFCSKASARGRLLALLIVLLGEAMVLSLLVDARAMQLGGAVVPERAGLWLALGLAVVAAGIMMRAWLRPAWYEALAAPGLRPVRWWPAAFHLGAYAALLGTTLLLSWSSPGRVPAALGWAWLVFGMLAVVSLIETTVSCRVLVRFLRLGWLPSLGVIAVGVLAWCAGMGSGRAWNLVAQATLDSAAWLLERLEPEIVYRPLERVLGTPRFVVKVAPACSGAEGIGLFVALSVVFLVAARSRLRLLRAVWLLPVGVVASWVANVLRIVALIELGSRWSPTVALGGFHSQVGWLLFGAVALGLCHAALCCCAVPTVRGREQTANPTTLYLLPLAVLLATSLVTAALSDGFDRWYALRVVAVGMVLGVVSRHLPGLYGLADFRAVGLGLLGYLLWIAFERPADAEQVAAWHATLVSLSPAARAAWIAMRVLGSVVTVPLAEELAFRGYLLPRMISRDFTRVCPRRLTVPAVAVSSLLFGLLHERWVVATLVGVLYALARASRGRLSDAVMAHATTNAVIAADVLLGGRWHLWM